MGTRTAARAKTKAKRLAQRQRTLRNRTGGRPRGNSAIEQAQQICQVPGSSAPYLHPASCTLHSGSCGDSAEESSSLKQVAAAALILGQNVTKTAEALGVDRRSVQRWGKYDPDFREALVDTKREVMVVSRQSLLSLAESAVEVVETKLTVEKNPRLALAFLRGIGAISPEPLPPPAAKTPTENENRAESATSRGTAANDSPATAGPEDCPAEDEPVYELTDLFPSQQQAIAGLFAGQSIAEVAQKIATSEQTVRGWLCHDEAFFTVLSGLQFERIVHLKHRLLKLLATAEEILRQGIAAGDGRLAMALVRGFGLLR